MINTRTESNLERKGFISRMQSVNRGRSSGAQDKNLEAGTEAGTVEEPCLWLGLP